jgi:hypothetical protein
MVEGSRPEAGLPIVEIARWIDADDEIVIEPARIGVGRGDRRVAESWQQTPRACTEEPLPRHRREGLDDRHVARQRRPQPQIFGEPTAN